MKSILLFGALCLQITGGYGLPPNNGVGAFAYQDSTGRRYGGTYGLRNGEVVDREGDFPENFSPPDFQDLDDFFPEYLKNLDNLLQEAFESSVENQKLAYNAAKKAFDITSNQAGYNSDFSSRFPFNNFPRFGGFPGMPGPQGFPSPFAGNPGFPNPGYGMPNFGGPNSAFAGAAIGPGYSQQVAHINPANPNNPNIAKMNQFLVRNNSPLGRSYSVSSSSYSSSSNVNGKEHNQRGAETVINDNGKITKYEVHS